MAADHNWVISIEKEVATTLLESLQRSGVAVS